MLSSALAHAANNDSDESSVALEDKEVANGSNVRGDAPGAKASSGEVHRYKDLLESVGLNDVKAVAQLPNPRVVSDTDIFCNRELKMSGIKAIGFDMDYTLA